MRLGFITEDNLPSNLETYKWYDRALVTAQHLDDELLAKLIESRTLWIRISKGFQVDEGRLADLLSYFEQDFRNSFIYFRLLQSMSISYSAREEYDQAIQFARRSQKIALGWHNLMWIGDAYSRLAGIYQKMDRPHWAAYALLECLDWHLAIGQIWQTLGFLWSTAVFFTELLGFDLGLQILSMVYRHPEAIPLYRQKIEEKRPLFEMEMEKGKYLAAWDKGIMLDFDSTVAQMRGALDSWKVRKVDKGNQLNRSFGLS